MEMTWLASLRTAAEVVVGGAADMSKVAARAAEKSARAPRFGTRNLLLPSNASFGADGGGGAIPARRSVNTRADQGAATGAWGICAGPGGYTRECMTSLVRLTQATERRHGTIVRAGLRSAA